MGKHKYFTMRELTYSITAYKYKINNTPTEEIKNNLDELMDCLDGFRREWGSPIIVTSGFRCEELNEKVGGSKNSGHKYGWAADMRPSNNKIMQFFEFAKEYFKTRDFDELILETNPQGNVWLHFSLKSYQGKQRKKVKMLNA